jgi:hypothetical protein
MALSNYEKQKRWRDKNRALYNLQQRQRRKTKGGDAKCQSVKPVTVPTVFRDDYGRVISEAQWKRLQERKDAAKDHGYTIDDYSQ